MMNPALVNSMREHDILQSRALRGVARAVHWLASGLGRRPNDAWKKMTVLRMILGVALVTALGLACAQLSAVPRSHFKIVERFPDRVGEIETLGVEVKSALPDGTVSEADLEKLSAFFSDGLREGSFGAVVNLTSGGNADAVGLVLTVHVNLLKAATQEERKKRVASHLHGIISLRNRVTGRSLGTATIWATGSGLDLKPNYAPNIVLEFTEAIREIIH
jgi:hypothetical protein